MVGIDLEKNTLKHLLEYMLVEEMLNAFPAGIREAKKAQLGTVRTYDDPNVVWPYLDHVKMQQTLDANGLLAHARCGDAEYLSFRARPAHDCIYAAVKARPEEWYNERVLRWASEE